MQILVAAIGKGRGGPEMQLYEAYRKRLPWQLSLKEIESHKTDPAQRREEETSRLLAAAAGSHQCVALDETGQTLTSREFAAQLKTWQDQGLRSVAFLIGGAGGLSEAARKQSDLVLSFGRMTWPHLLVRTLLAEQLYRAHSVLINHPYHRD